MLQNNKKTQISRERWEIIFGFIVNRESMIKTMLYEAALNPDLFMASVTLTNAAFGELELATECVFPSAENKIKICSFLRPPVFIPSKILQAIEKTDTQDMVMNVLNQIEVKSSDIP